MKTSDLHYDPETGVVSWKASGREAGYIHSSGYRYIGVDGRMLLAHRLIFDLMGEHLVGEVDHRNGDRADNKWSNLRRATRSGNTANRRNSSSSPLPKGVWFDKSRQRYAAGICCAGKRKNLGRFATADEAAAAYAVAASSLFGEFARTT